PYNWLYGRVWRHLGFAEMPFEGAKRLGVGLATTILAVYGLLRERDQPGVRVLLVCSGALIVLATMLPGGHSLWRILYDFLPGAKAIRAVGRIAFVLLIPASIGVAFVFDRASQRLPAVVWMLLAALVVLEQGQTMPSYDKKGARAEVERIARQIPR